MALPHFPSNNIIITPIEIIKYNNYCVDIISNDLNYDELIYLSDNLFKIKNKKLFFNVNISDKNTIEIFNILTKLIDKTFNFNVNITNKEKEIITIFKYKNVKLKNILESFSEFDWQKDMKILKIKFKYESIKQINIKNYKTYLRLQKINKILKHI